MLIHIHPMFGDYSNLFIVYNLMNKQGAYPAREVVNTFQKLHQHIDRPLLILLLLLVLFKSGCSLVSSGPDFLFFIFLT